MLPRYPYNKEAIVMKRLLVIMVMVVLFVAPTHAESIDLESMSTDELLALRNQINSILTERVASDASVIYSGNYTVGTDIKAGQIGRAHV